MNLPTHIQARVKQEAEAHSHETRKMLDYSAMDDFKAGATRLFEILSEQAPEFDEKAAHDKRYSGACFNGDLFVAGARFQHQQSAAVIAALRAEVESLKTAHAIVDSAAHCLRKERDTLRAECERLNGDIAWLKERNLTV